MNTSTTSVATSPTHSIDAAALRKEYEFTLKVQAGYQKRIHSPVNKAVSEVVFNTAHKALVDTRGGINDGKFKVVSAPTGSSKTTSSVAFAVAAFNTTPGFSCAFIVEEIRTAQEVYEQLTELLPPEYVGVWSSKHDAKRPPEDVEEGYPLFTIEQMRDLPIVVFTHTKWLGEMDRNKDEGVRSYKGVPRDVLFIDEQPKSIDILERSKHKVGLALDDIARMEPDHPWVSKLNTVFERMKAVEGTDGDAMEAVELLDCLEASDFSEEKAEAIWRTHYKYAPSQEYMDTFRFLKACTLGYVFFNRMKPRGFVAYLPKFKPEPNQILLDATADLSGLSVLMGGEFASGLPEINYCNLTINHLGMPAKFKSMRAVLDVRSRAVDYAEWITNAVMENSSEGDTILVVIHKDLITTQGLFPYAATKPVTDAFPGRNAFIINWGQGIGSNLWKHATKVFLMSEFYQPRKIMVATTLGASSKQAQEAPLDKLSKQLSGEFLDVYEGDILRWIKQLSCRGNVRNINLDGTCGHMDLYLAMDFNRLVLNMDRLFPGAKAPTRIKRKVKKEGEEVGSEVTTGRHGLVNLLSTTGETQISFKGLCESTGVSNKKLSRELASPAVAATIKSYGWSLTTSKALGLPGKGNWLVRQPQQQ